MASKKKPKGDYEVGYGKPPKQYQFKEGTSGNLRGRPKGTKNLKTDLMEELGEPIRITENGKTRRLSKQRVMVKGLVNRAIKGNDRATAKTLDLILRIAGIEGDAADAGVPLTAEERAIVRSMEERFMRRAGLTEDENGEGDDGADDGEGTSS